MTVSCSFNGIFNLVKGLLDVNYSHRKSALGFIVKWPSGKPFALGTAENEVTFFTSMAGPSHFLAWSLDPVDQAWICIFCNYKSLKSTVADTEAETQLVDSSHFRVSCLFQRNLLHSTDCDSVGVTSSQKGVWLGDEVMFTAGSWPEWRNRRRSVTGLAVGVGTLCVLEAVSVKQPMKRGWSYSEPPSWLGTVKSLSFTLGRRSLLHVSSIKRGRHV